jgi:hypothetical protein
MAALPPRALTSAEFRVLVVIAFITHAVVLFVLPQMPFLFSDDVMQLMRYGGHGARVNPTHPVIYAVYLLPFPAFVGLYLFQTWGRNLLLAYFALTLFGSFVLGTFVSGPPETFFASVAALVDGAVLGFAFLNPPRIEGQPSNSTVETDARKSGARGSP